MSTNLICKNLLLNYIKESSIIGDLPRECLLSLTRTTEQNAALLFTALSVDGVCPGVSATSWLRDG